jgi:hypothetical protein
MKIRSAQFSLLAAVLTAAVCLLMASGCARIADPQPPEVLIPKAATDLTLSQIADSVILTVSLPDQNTDGSPVSKLRSVEVFYVAQPAPSIQITSPLPPLAEKEFLAQATQGRSIPSSQFNTYLHNKYLIIRDTPKLAAGLSMYAQLFRYAVIFVNHKGQAAGLSNQVCIQPVLLPPPPEEVTVQMTENAVILKWKSPSNIGEEEKLVPIAGYNIYRSEDAASFSPAPINPAPLQQTEYQDRDFDLDKTYFYSISSIGKLLDPFAESRPSPTIELKTRDVFPPAPPEDFNAIFEGNKVVLLWTSSPSSDVAGYRLYREDLKTSSRQRLQESLITELSCRDDKIELNKSYRYIILAVDTHGNESVAAKTEVSTQ